MKRTRLLFLVPILMLSLVAFGCSENSSPAESCNDKVKNQNETDVDCGGSCSACTDGATCLVSMDCSSGYCDNGLCADAPVATCSDNIQTQDETDVDCGGTICPACGNGATCTSSDDCNSGTCDNGTCAAPPVATCSDNIQNQDETAVDCGGVICTACADGSACAVSADCISGICDNDTCNASAYESIRVWPQDVGVFKELGEQQFTAYGKTPSGEEFDISNQVDWFVEEFPFEEQTTEAINVVAINENGLATILNPTWGRVNVSSCYPKGCSQAGPLASSASTSMTVLSISPWVEPICKSPSAVVHYDVTEYLSNVRITANGLYWDISPGTTFTVDPDNNPENLDVGDWARLWAIYSDTGYRTWISIGWDYTTNDAGYKHVTGYGEGHHWVGQMISTICDQTSCPVNPQACNGRKRSNIFFVAN